MTPARRQQLYKAQAKYKKSLKGRAIHRVIQTRYRESKKGKKTRKLYNQSLRGKETKRRWLVKNREKVRAHQLVFRAVKSGVIQREPCAVCGSSKSQAHHEDYSKPLEVVWLCQPHHFENHRLSVERAR